MSLGKPGFLTGDTNCIGYSEFNLAYTNGHAPHILLDSTHKDAVDEHNKYKIFNCDKDNPEKCG